MSLLEMLASVCQTEVSTLVGGGMGFNGFWGDGVGTATAFNGPSGVAVDAVGNVLVVDTNNQRVRRVTPSEGMFRGLEL